MTGEKLDEKAIFNAARAIGSAEARAEYLRQACGGDAKWIERIQALLRGFDEQASFLESPPVTIDVARTAGANEPIAERLGTIIGPYKLVQQIGEGGMGVVFMAEQSAPIHRMVALKIIKPGMDTRQVIARFEAERQALALMDHPSIAKVFDAGATESGRPYFVMELVKGVPITQYCDERHLAPRERLELFVPVCQAVQHAHQKGIIHRDLKPSNVMVALYDDKPVPKVIDFGVAKATGQKLTEQTLFTAFGQVVGTLEYMSPEQAVLNQLDVDTRSDVYSLGVLLYELLTGTTPVSRKRFGEVAFDEMLRIIREDEPPKPSTRLSTTDELPSIAANRGLESSKLSGLMRGDLDWIVMKCLEKDRNRRYETANGLALDIQRFLMDEPVTAGPPTLGYRLGKLVRRHRRAVLAVAIVAFSLIGGIIGTTWGMLRAFHAEGEAVSESNQKADALTLKEAALTESREQLFLALVNQARADRSSHRVGQRFEALKAIRQAAQMCITPEVRSEAVAALVLPDVEVAQEWEGWTENTVNVSFDAAFQRYARLDKQGRVSVCRMRDGREEIILQLPAHGQPRFDAVSMSPDGRFVVYLHSLVRAPEVAKFCVWKLDGPTPVLLVEEPVGYHGLARDFHSNGQQLAIAQADNSVGVYDLATGKRVQRLAIGTAPHHLAFHPRENRLAVTVGGAVQLFDTDTGQELAALRHSAEVTVTSSVAWYPDGRRLAVGCNDSKIHIWDTETATEIMSPWKGHTNQGIVLAISRGGDLVVSGDWGGQVRLWDAVSGRPLISLPGQVGLQFAPEDRLLGVGFDANNIRLWRLAKGRELSVLRRRNAEAIDKIGYPVVHADGRTLAACMDHWLIFFDLISGEELTSVRLPHAAYPVFFDAAGGWVTGGRRTLHWPTRPDAKTPEVLRVGPPEEIALGLESYYSSGVSASTDGRLVAVPDGNATIVLHRDRPDRRVSLGPQFDVRFTAVSPDGRQVVTCSHWEDGRSRSAWIWNVESGKKIHELPLVGSTSAKFSPDGRWLMTNTGGAGCRLWEAGTWREVRRFNHAGYTFSPDSRLLALSDVYSVIRLVETATGREVARLTGPEPSWYLPACFSPDGTRLISAGPDPSALYVWDLRLIRRQLKEMGLDWEWPEFAQADATQADKPKNVDVLLGEFDEAQRSIDENSNKHE